MMYQQAAPYNTGPAVVRTAPTPFGPWSSALTVTPPTITTPAGSSNPNLSITCATVGSKMPGALGCRAFNLHPELDTTGTNASLVYSYYQSGAQGDSFSTVCSTVCTTAAYPTVPGQVELASIPVSTLPAVPGATGPVVTGVSPSSGSTAGGKWVTVRGTGFSGVTSVDVGGVPATITSASSTGLTVVVPSTGAPRTVDVTVTTPGGASATSAADHFTYQSRSAGPNLTSNRAGSFFSARLSVPAVSPPASTPSTGAT
jgi:hypothetical protein